MKAFRKPPTNHGRPGSWGEAQRLTTALGTSRSLSAVSAIVVDRIADKGKAWRFLRCRSTREGLTCIALSPVLVGARRRVCAGLQCVARSPRHTVVLLVASSPSVVHSSLGASAPEAPLGSSARTERRASREWKVNRGRGGRSAYKVKLELVVWRSALAGQPGHLFGRAHA